MAQDWKEALAALRGEEMPIAEENAVDDNNEKVSNIQKEPLHVVVDRKGRNGKSATIIEGFQIPISEVQTLARKLKQQLGVGGSVRETEILIQGELKDKVTSILKKLNFKVK